MTDDMGLNILSRLNQNLREGGKDTGSTCHQVSPAVYLDRDRYQRELDVLFRARPLLAGHVSQVASPGDFFTTTLLGLPVLVTRDDEGRLNAFVNACLHRAAVIETGECGNRRDFVCPYHGWSYGMDGRLNHVTDAISFTGAGLENARLVRLPVAEKHGLVFVQPLPGKEGAAEVDLGDIGPQFDALGVADHRVFRTVRMPLQFNWKFAIDGSLETYHVNFLHQRAATLFTGMATIFDDYGTNLRFITARRSLKKISLEDLASTAVREQVMFTYHLFPAGFITAPHDHMFLQYYTPTGIDSCEMVYSLLVPKASLPQRADHWERTWQLGQSVIAEDYGVARSIQQVYAAGFGAPAILGRFEHAVARFHEICSRELAGEMV